MGFFSYKNGGKCMPQIITKVSEDKMFRHKKMAKKIAALVFLTLLGVLTAVARTELQWIQDPSDNEDGICTLFVEPQGYSCEEHKVTTEDGYILSMQRIPTGRSGDEEEAKPPVVLQHGLLCDASIWLLNSPNQSLGFIMADSGFDVWLTNIRVTNYSREHTSLSPNDPAYWNWSWDELAAYDLLATLQYVYDQTGQQMHYVGHSLGTLMALGAFSKQEMLNLVKSAALLCPIAYLGNLSSPLGRAAADGYLIDALYLSGNREFVPGSQLVSILLDTICLGGLFDCNDIMSVVTGPNCCLNSSKSYLDHIDEPTATKNMVHLAQTIRQGNIAMYDYGTENENTERYGQPTPPEYNMSSIPKDLPLFLAYGGNDMLSVVNDVQKLLDSLADHDPDKLVKLYTEDYGHLDYVVGVSAKEVVYDLVIDFFRAMSTNTRSSIMEPVSMDDTTIIE